MRRYFASEPRLSRQEIERQAQEAIDARVGMGRPPEEEFAPLHARLAQMDRAVAPPPVAQVPEPQPIQIHEVNLPASAPDDAPKPRRRQSVGAARQNAN